MSIAFAKGLSLPDEAVTARQAILGISGSGKSNTAGVFVEGLAERELPFVVIDTEGSWYGLRADKHGKPGGGLQIPIFGGQHGDLPLDPKGGAFLARLIAEKRLSCVLDLELLDSDYQKKPFLLAFARELLKANRSALAVIAEECDIYIAQNPAPQDRQLLGAFHNLVQRGRKRGIGVTLISQRPALVSKTALTQCETLIVHRMTGKHDIAAIKDWVRYQQQDEKMVASLSTLETGEAWVWSPGFLRVMRRVRVPMRETFDSARTPGVNETIKAAKLADIDVGALRKEMAASIQAAEEADPEALLARVRQLEAELEQAREAAPASAEPVRESVLTADDRSRLHRFAESVRALEHLCAEGTQALREILARVPDGEPPPPPARARVATPKVTITASPAARHDPTLEGEIPKGVLAVLLAVAVFEAAGRQATNQGIEILTNYRETSRRTYVGEAVGRGLLEREGDGYKLTAPGSAAAVRAGSSAPPSPWKQNPAFRRMLQERLPAGEWQVLSHLIAVYPAALSNAELEKLTGYKETSRRTYLGALRGAGLARPVGTGTAAAPIVMGR